MSSVGATAMRSANQTLQRDSAGNTVQRTFNDRNQLVTETRFAGAAAENFAALTANDYQLDGSSGLMVRRSHGTTTRFAQ